MIKITRLGNSCGVRVPAPLLREAALRAGDYVTIRLMDSGDLRLRPVRGSVPAKPLKEPAQPVVAW
jgi:antitoxin MazE